MKVWFGQVYIEGGVDFPFSHLFQRHLSAEVTALVEPSAKFIEQYGVDFELMFNVSAKRRLPDNGIRGPTVFKKTKDVEYTVFLPFDVIIPHADAPRRALRFLLKGVGDVFDKLEIDKIRLLEQQDAIIEGICADATMLAAPHWSGAPNKTWSLFKTFFDKTGERQAKQ